jgi:tRNA pseudouridine38-40 synthase
MAATLMAAGPSGTPTTSSAARTSGPEPARELGPVRLRIDLGYDGTDFAGWAEQPGRRTVAGTLTDSLRRLFGQVSGLTVAGRTDAGVHATGQVCQVDVEAQRWAALSGTVIRRLAGLLPADVRAYSVTEVPASFDARFAATFRRYRYLVCDAECGVPPLLHRYVLDWPRPLELARLTEASQGLLGEHDFAAFCRRKEHGSMIRTLTALSWRRDPAGLVEAELRADAFCQAMVRSLVGALLAVGDGRRPPAWPAALLARTERANEVVVVPAHGLTLVEVGYPARAEEYAAHVERTRRRRHPVREGQ